jgi:hypothetical protein
VFIIFTTPTRRRFYRAINNLALRQPLATCGESWNWTSAVVANSVMGMKIAERIVT